MAASKNCQLFVHDAVVLHSEDEIACARAFCEYVREIDIGSGRKPDILTMDSFANPGKTMVGNLNDAILRARLIFCSESYYHEDDMGNFFGDVAILHKIPDRFVKLKIKGQNAPASGCSTLPSVSSFHGLQLGPNWKIEDQSHRNLLKLFCTPMSSGQSQHENMPSLASNDNLEVLNRSISSTSSLPSFTSSDETVPKQLIGDHPGPSSLSSQQSQAPDSLDGHGLAMRDLVADNDEVGRREEEITQDASDQQRLSQAPTHSSDPLGLPAERTGLQSQQFNPPHPDPESLLSGPWTPTPGLSAQNPRAAAANLTSASQRAVDSAAAIFSAQLQLHENGRSATAVEEGRAGTGTIASDTASVREDRRSPDGAYAQSLPSNTDVNADREEEKRRIKEQIEQLQQKLREMK